MVNDDELLMDLATPSNSEQAARMLRHPLEQALEFCEGRQQIAPNDAEFWRRLAGSIRKGLTLC